MEENGVKKKWGGEKGEKCTKKGIIYNNFKKIKKGGESTFLEGSGR